MQATTGATGKERAARRLRDKIKALPAPVEQPLSRQVVRRAIRKRAKRDAVEFKLDVIKNRRHREPVDLTPRPGEMETMAAFQQALKPGRK